MWKGARERRACEWLFPSGILHVLFSTSPRRGSPYAGGLGEQPCCWGGCPQGTVEGCLILFWPWVTALGVFFLHVMLSPLCALLSWPLLGCCVIIVLWLGILFFKPFGGHSLPFHGIWGRSEKWLSNSSPCTLDLLFSGLGRGLQPLYVLRSDRVKRTCGTGTPDTWTSGKAPLRECIILVSWAN